MIGLRAERWRPSSDRHMAPTTIAPAGSACSRRVPASRTRLDRARTSDWPARAVLRHVHRATTHRVPPGLRHRDRHHGGQGRHARGGMGPTVVMEIPAVLRYDLTNDVAGEWLIERLRAYWELPGDGALPAQWSGHGAACRSRPER